MDTCLQPPVLTGPNYEFAAGDTFSLRLTVTADEGGPITGLAGYVVQFFVKAQADQDDAAALITTQTSDGSITIAGVQAIIALTSAQTAGLTKGADYFYFLRVTTPDAVRATLYSGVLHILP